nr:oleate hydratase [Kineosporia sp. R_H_3]
MTPAQRGHHHGDNSHSSHDSHDSHDSPRDTGREVWIIGGGIAGLAAAAFAIRDAGVPGPRVHILEESGVVGGSMDGAVSPTAAQAFVSRGGRMLEERAYRATWDLFDTVPSLSDPSTSVRKEVVDFNAQVKTHARARLIAADHRILDSTGFGLSARDRAHLLRLIATPEPLLGSRRIDEMFDDRFFATPFWRMWRTTFAFQRWHSAVEMRRYCLRFLHVFDHLDTLSDVRRTVYNQYDSMIVPLQRWLVGRGVDVRLGTRVDDVELVDGGPQGRRVTALHLQTPAGAERLGIGERDIALITIGSITADARYGGNDTVPELVRDHRDHGWSLWEQIARKAPDLGRPAAFFGNIDEHKWESFTLTMRDDTLLRRITEYSGNLPGTGALMTWVDSGWHLSVVVPHQPHFAGMPAGTSTLWGYGFDIDHQGDHVPLPMSQATGRQILTELVGHLGFDDILDHVQATTDVTTVMCRTPQPSSRAAPPGTGPPSSLTGLATSRSSDSSPSSPKTSSSPWSTRCTARCRPSTHSSTSPANPPPPLPGDPRPARRRERGESPPAVITFRRPGGRLESRSQRRPGGPPRAAAGALASRPAGGPAGVAAARRCAALTLLAVAVLLAQAIWTRRRHTNRSTPAPHLDLVVRPGEGRPYRSGSSAAGSAGACRLAALGDSGMSGVGADDVDGVLAVQVARRLAEQLSRPVHVVGYARAGARTRDVLHEQVPLVSGADCALLMVGTNDVVGRTPLRRLHRDTRTLLSALDDLAVPVVMSSLPEVRAMLALPRPLRDVIALHSRVVEAVQRAALSAAQTQHLVWVDVRRQTGPLFLTRRDTLSADRFHPSSAGYALIADSLAPALARVMADSPASGPGWRRPLIGAGTTPEGGGTDTRPGQRRSGDIGPDRAQERAQRGAEEIRDVFADEGAGVLEDLQPGVREQSGQALAVREREEALSGPRDEGGLGEPRQCPCSIEGVLAGNASDQGGEVAAGPRVRAQRRDVAGHDLGRDGSSGQQAERGGRPVDRT